MTFFGKQLIPMIFQSTLFFNKAHGNLAKCFKFVGRKGNLHKSLTNNSPLSHMGGHVPEQLTLQSSTAVGTPFPDVSTLFQIQNALFSMLP